MLLIFLLGLIAKLAFVCDGCNFGSSEVNNFNISQFTGSWYVVLHSSNPFDNSLKCFVANFGSPSSGKFLINFTAYDISKKGQVTFLGYGTNWNTTGYMEFNIPVGIWNGPVQVIETDYSSHVIGKICPIGLNETDVYVTYRTPHPDAATVNETMTHLQKNSIDVTQLLNWPVCQ